MCASTVLNAILAGGGALAGTVVLLGLAHFLVGGRG